MSDKNEKGSLKEKFTKKSKHLSITKLFKIVRDDNLLIALTSKKQVEKGKNHKAPSINWERTPRDYKGLEDSKYGTAIRCDYIKKLKKYLVVLDFDKPLKKDDIPINILTSVAKSLIENTYSVKTPSGGIHIYLLSKDKPKQSQPKINIDYQTNTGMGKGKYVVANYRWDKKGNKKEHYLKIPKSPNKILLVNNSDKILENILEGLIEKGYIITPKLEHLKEIANVFRPYIENRRSINNFSLAIAGYLRKKGFDEKTAKKIISEVFKNTSDIQKRLENVKQTYKRPIKDIEGWQHLKEIMGKEDLEKLSELTKNSDGNLKVKIFNLLSKNREPSGKTLADFVNSKLDLFKNLETNKYYERTKEGELPEIDERRIIEFCNDEFGVNNISTRRCSEVLKYVTNPIKKNYDLIEFKNGILNTRTRKFNPDKKRFDEVPKLVLNLNWNPKAKKREIGKIIDKILDNPEYPNDKERWLRANGHAFMGNNRIDKMTVVEGPSGTGKSTLSTIQKRLFNYSELPTSTINSNERFTLHPLIDKDVNIDDDINNGILKSIGTLNTIITGNGLEVEVKGENRSIKAENPQIPRLFCNGNTLPPVFGEGFERRLLLIHARNIIEDGEKKDFLQADILLGKYDDMGMEWLVYTSITTYWEKINEPITTMEEQAKMKEEYDFRSYPILKAVEALFIDDYSGIENINVREVNRWVKSWHIWAYEVGKISKEHRKPSIRQISKAMNKAGFQKKNIRFDVDNVVNCYEDIKLDKGFKKLLKPYYDKLSSR